MNTDAAVALGGLSVILACSIVFITIVPCYLAALIHAARRDRWAWFVFTFFLPLLAYVYLSIYSKWFRRAFLLAPVLLIIASVAKAIYDSWTRPSDAAGSVPSASSAVVAPVILPSPSPSPSPLPEADWKYEINASNEATIWFYSGAGGAVTIPATIDGITVTSIGNDAFSGRNDVTSVTIPNSVTSIGRSVFWGCTSLTSVAIGGSVTSVETEAFYNCSSLTSVTIPNSVTTLGDRSFAYCTSLRSVTIGNGVTAIGISAFWGCASLTSLTIGSSVTSIGDYAFADCTSLTSVTIPNSVTTIGELAFGGCTSLTIVTIPRRFSGELKNGGRVRFTFTE